MFALIVLFLCLFAAFPEMFFCLCALFLSVCFSVFVRFSLGVLYATLYTLSFFFACRPLGSIHWLATDLVLDFCWNVGLRPHGLLVECFLLSFYGVMILLAYGFLFWKKGPPLPPSTRPQHCHREYLHGLDFLRRCEEEEERLRRARADAFFARRAFAASSDSGQSAMPAASSTPASASAAAAAASSTTCVAASFVRPKNRSPVVGRVLGRSSIGSCGRSAVLVAEKPTFAPSVSRHYCWPSHAALRSAASSAVTAPAIIVAAVNETPVMVQPEVYPSLPSFPAVAMDVHESSPQTLVSSYRYSGSIAQGFRRSGLPLMLCLWLHRNRLSSDRCARVLLARKGKLLARRNRSHQRSINKDEAMDWEFSGPCTEVHFPSGATPMMIDEDVTSSDYLFSSGSVGDSSNSHSVSSCDEMDVDIMYEEDIIMEEASHSLAAGRHLPPSMMLSVRNPDATVVAAVDAPLSAVVPSSINSLSVNDVYPAGVWASSCSAEVHATDMDIDASVDCSESDVAPHRPGVQGASATVASPSLAPVLRERLVRSLGPVASSNSVSSTETMTTTFEATATTTTTTTTTTSAAFFTSLSSAASSTATTVKAESDSEDNDVNDVEAEDWLF
ncbi:hypothetical protein BDF20DRAFT_830996 [Mycotypha africana]|uniref:uncharacterized protein n=1 Tax=Mycotypha africana TaxID=64632 RepID=UPI002301E3F0|nr:uncharacterized protein BDF20DRAFT_830996 [Mycotypha africana]KAI8990907.1 hypothetical protein BDF20DRAFT_830996 [Mycotypha africana]